MINEDDKTIAPKFQELLGKIKAMGVAGWLSGKADRPDLAGLVYLCKFAFFTGILTKSQIGACLGADRQELKGLVRGWYDDHRKMGCGTC